MTDNNKYYNSYTEFLKDRFGGRVQKISVNTGMTCPNRDGTKGTTGCIYCLNDAFTPSYCKPEKSIQQQIKEGIEFHQNRYRRAYSYIVYFQSYTNTYGETEQLYHKFKEALECDKVIGITVGTRPDCVNTEIAQMLNILSKKVYVKIELGIESVYDDTLLFIKRGHTNADTYDAIEILNNHNIPVGGHFILGLPGEDRSKILNTTATISRLKLLSVKLHQLQILKGTELEKIYLQSNCQLSLFEMNEYIDLVIDFAEHLHTDIYIERFAAEVPPKYLVAPQWGKIRYHQILQHIIRRFSERNTRQGINFK